MSNMHQTKTLYLQHKPSVAHYEDPKSERSGPIILTPINELPGDVLYRLFELLCDDSLSVVLPLSHPIWSCGGRPLQITLSHVCSTWRAIILDIPACWNNVKLVPIYLNTPESLDSMVKVSNTWLSRAKGLPCSLEIDFSMNDYDDCWSDDHWQMDWHRNIVCSLVSLHKFKKLGVTFTDHQLRDFLQLPDDKLSCIENLRLRYIGHSNTAKLTLPLDLYKLSNLTSFSLLPDIARKESLKNFFKFAGIHWHNLRHIQLCAIMPPSFCLQALRGSSAVLETCSLVIAGDHIFVSSPQIPVHLSQLRELKVVDYSIHDDDKVLEHFLLLLDFPTLKSLTLRAPESYLISVDVEMLLRVQNASRMHLEELNISGSMDGIDVQMLLMGFPSLRRLELYNMPVIFTVYAMFAIGVGFLGIFLENLIINDTGLDLEKLLRMVIARSSYRRVVNKNQIQVEVSRFKSVTFYSTETKDGVDGRILNLINMVHLLGVNLDVIFWDDDRYNVRYM